MAQTKETFVFVLATLALYRSKNKGVTTSQLAEIADTTTIVIHSMMDRLVSRGLATRREERSGMTAGRPQGKRVVHYYQLTPAGRRYIEREIIAKLKRVISMPVAA